MADPRKNPYTDPHEGRKAKGACQHPPSHLKLLYEEKGVKKGLMCKLCGKVWNS